MKGVKQSALRLRSALPTRHFGASKEYAQWAAWSEQTAKRAWTVASHGGTSAVQRIFKGLVELWNKVVPTQLNKVCGLMMFVLYAGPLLLLASMFTPLAIVTIPLGVVLGLSMVVLWMFVLPLQIWLASLYLLYKQPIGTLQLLLALPLLAFDYLAVRELSDETQPAAANEDEPAAAANEDEPAAAGAEAQPAVAEEEPVRGSSTHVDLNNLKECSGDLSAEELAVLRSKTKSAAEFAATLTPEEQASYGCKPGVAASAVREDSDSDGDGADFQMGGDNDNVMLGDY